MAPVPGLDLPEVDRQRERVMELAARQRHDPLAFISNRELFGDLAQPAQFAGEFSRWLDSLHARGARATLEAVVEHAG